MSTIALAECIRLAANIRETSFDRVGAAKCQLENIALPKHMLDNLDYSSFYTVSLRDACTKAEESYADFKGFGDVVYMLLNQNWNEALDWANLQLGPDKAAEAHAASQG